MKKHQFPDVIDKVIRFFLYVLVFWLPYSKAVIESCVITSVILWIIKHIWIFCSERGKGSIRLRIASAFRLEPSFLNQPIYAFIGVAVLSLIGCIFWPQSLKALITKTLEWFAIYFLFLEVFKEKKHFQILFTVFLITTFATAFDALVQYHITGKDFFFGYELIEGKRATAGFGHSNALGAYISIALPIFAASLHLNNKRWFKLLLGFTFIMLAWSLVITFSRGALLSVIIGCLYVIIATRKRKAMQYVLGGILIIAVVSSIAFSPIASKLTFRMDNQNIVRTTYWRLGVWKDTLVMIKDRPFLGHGINTYMQLFQKYRRRPEGSGGEYNPTYAHNSYLQLAAEVGLVGVSVFVWMLYRLLTHSHRFFMRMVHNTSLQGVGIMSLGLVGGCIAFLTHSLVENNFYSLQLTALFWLTAGILAAQEKLLSNLENCDINEGC